MSAALAGADHQTLIRRLVAADVNHCLRDFGFAAHAKVGRPEKQIARLKRIEFERIIALRVPLQSSRLYAPKRIARARRAGRC